MDPKTHHTYSTRMTLLQKMQRQDDEMAWDEFVSIYSDYIYVIIRKMNVSVADTGDIQQQVFLKLWKQVPNLDLDNMKRFRGYVATTAKNCTYDFFRREARRGGNKKVEYEEQLHAIEDLPQTDVEQIAEREWEQLCVCDGIQEYCRKVFTGSNSHIQGVAGRKRFAGTGGEKRGSLRARHIA